jgi:SAM-dependent methyltransferase
MAGISIISPNMRWTNSWRTKALIFWRAKRQAVTCNGGSGGFHCWVENWFTYANVFEGVFMISQEFYDSQYTEMVKMVGREWEWRELSGAVKAENIITIAHDLPIRTILDVGCGTGAVLAHLAKVNFGEHYYALDISQYAISIVNRRSDIPKLVEAKVFDGLHIPYDNKKFDLAILSHVVEHVIDPVPLLREVARVAHYIAVEVPLEANLYTLLKVYVLRSPYRQELGHIHWFNQHNFKRLLESAGLEIAQSRMVYVPDHLYFFRKGKSWVVTFSLGIRKILRTLSSDLYSYLLTDHFIALAHSP